MKKSAFLPLFCLLGLLFFSILSDAAPIASLPGYDWEVIPTNPECTPTLSYPLNAWCFKSDLEKNLLRPNTPDARILHWLTQPDIKRVRLAYLTFSNPRVTEELCELLKKDIPVEVVLDNSKTSPSMEALRSCNSERLLFYPRGNSSGIGFAHNKLTYIERTYSEQLQLVISSGNMTSGTILQHENWHFVQLPTRTHFAALHECLWESLVQSGETAREFKAAMNNCRSQIPYSQENGIQSYFIPGDSQAMLMDLEQHMQKAQWIAGASHRFNGQLIKNLLGKMLEKQKSVRMIYDDDIYWALKTRKDFGLNQYMEALVVQDLIKKNMAVKYVQTNHQDYLLQHNKFFVWGQEEAMGVFMGAGNFTNSAFTKNFENFYIVTLPEVVQSLKNYHDHLWNELGTFPHEMPKKVQGR